MSSSVLLPRKRLQSSVSRPPQPAHTIHRDFTPLDRLPPFIQASLRSGCAESGAMAPQVAIDAVTGAGRPIDRSVREAFEPSFGASFEAVRIHDDAQAAAAADSVGARAYTAGNHIVFAAGEYQPRNSSGQRTIAHELAHVVQQNGTARQLQRQGPPAPPPAPAVTFHPGVNHGHAPSGRWADVQANPNSDFWENRVCAHFPPSTVVSLAIHEEFSDKPLGLEHLNWYLGNGAGSDFDEDANLLRMLANDRGVQALIAGFLPATAPPSGIFTYYTRVDQGDYHIQDFRFAFGAIDELDFQADYTSGMLHCWFQDRYEWHPVYPGLYTKMSGDVARETNCVHAALVELKSGGAADYWMKGEARVPLSLIRGAYGSSRGGGTPGTEY
jgi:hypothetical protein